jgi:pimeloyl-ACP methyl ester carboxylesterase
MGRSATSAGAEPFSQLIRFEATDGLPLSGLLYGAPASAGRVAVWIHGTGGASVFDTARTNLMARVFVKQGIAFFPFNNRGAHVIRRYKRRFVGSAMERIRDSVKDIDGALRELRHRGYRDITLIGHSTGANKIAVYDHYKPRNRVRRYVLVAGADDAGLLYDELGPRRFQTLLKKSRTMPPNALMPDRILSWRAFYDMANPNGDYNVFPFRKETRGRRPFRYLRAMRKPSLLLYGDADRFATSRDVATLAENVGPNAEIVVMRDADHGFTGREEEVAKLIAGWISAW